MARSRGNIIVQTLGEMAFGGRDGCGCQGCATMIFLLFVGVGWITTHGHQLLKAGALVVGVASTAVLTRETLRRMKWPHKRIAIADGPVPLAQIAPGVAHTAGLVGIDRTPVPVPLEGAPCVFFRIVVTDDGAPLVETQSAETLVLEDGAGAKLTVKLEGAKWKLDRTCEIDSLPNRPNVALDKFLADRGLTARGEARAHVEWIAPHELVFVRGTVERVGEDAADYRTHASATFVMTGATIALHEAPKE